MKARSFDGIPCADGEAGPRYHAALVSRLEARNNFVQEAGTIFCKSTGTDVVGLHDSVPIRNATCRAPTAEQEQNCLKTFLRKVVPTADERRDLTAAVGRRTDLASALLLHVTAATDGCRLRGAYALASRWFAQFCSSATFGAML